MKDSIIQGDCRLLMAEMPDNTIDAIVTDPPYELGFMGKAWDKSGIAYDPSVWNEVFRVLKPGAHILVFGGTRTHHRLWCAIEDAGFQIRDTLAWVYGSGFPKSLDVSKALDKLAGAEREVIGINPNIKGRKNSMCKNPIPFNSRFDPSITASASPAAHQWSGWGTGLKPALEPICLARKPLSERNVALNVLKWGTGGINIDDCRIEVDKVKEYDNRLITGINNVSRGKHRGGVAIAPDGNNNLMYKSSGRFPSNLIHDGSDEVLELFPNAGGGHWSYKQAPDGGLYKHGLKDMPDAGNDRTAGSAARFFMKCEPDTPSRFLYCPKASRSERDAGLEDIEPKQYQDRGCHKSSIIEHPPEYKVKNNHPTVKPLKLMRYLITLITPPGGIVLDPFAGSGSTLVAAKQLGFPFIGIEISEPYVAMAEKRLNELGELI